MVLLEALEAIGVSGSIMLVVGALVALWHGRTALHVFSAAGLYAKVAGVFAFALVVAASGLIPGIHLEVNVGTVGAFIGGLWEFLASLVPILSIAS